MSMRKSWQVMSGVETKSPGYYTRGVREKVSDRKGFDTADGSALPQPFKGRPGSDFDRETAHEHVC